MLRPMAADPDSRARTHLANERTFLAWFRTGITLVALGLAAAQLLGSPGGPGEEVVHVLATLVIATGGLMAAIGGARYFRGRGEIDATRFQPASTSIAVTAGLALLTAAVAIGLVWLLRPVS
jgi:putative membrane protein